MKTVSTLCATSTVGIAACGYALARPYDDGSNDYLAGARALPNVNCPPAILEPIAQLNGNDVNDAEAFPSVPMDTLPARPSTSRRWLRRLSESFSSTSNSPSLTPSSSAASSWTSRARSSSTSQNNSRPPTRNKLVKRSPSQRPAARNSLVMPSHARRPSSAIYQTSARGESPHLSLINASRPSTSGPEPIRFRPYEPEPVNTWRPFFPVKRRKIAHSPAGQKVTKDKATLVRRIFPNMFWGPQRAATLVAAPTVNREFADTDTDSVISARNSLYMESRPVSHMGDIPTQSRTRQRASTAVSTSSPKRNVRRSFSLSNFLNSPRPRPSSRSREAADDTSDREIYSTGSSGGRSSAYGAIPSPYIHHSHGRAASPFADERQREPLAPIQSLSLLELSLEPPPPPGSSPTLDDGHIEPLSPADRTPTSAVDSPNANASRSHRLSLLSASEHASTLVGSESENEFGSETVFDSMRTRISELAPIRVDNIFNLDDLSGPENNDLTPLEDKYARQYTSLEDLTPVKNYDSQDRTPTNDRKSFQPIKVTLDEDEDGWSSDWDLPSGSGDDEDNRLSGLGGLRPYSGLLSGSRIRLHAHSNTSNTSFGTAPERMSTDGSSLRETNSILDWNDGVSAASSPSSHVTCRPKTVHARESLLSSTRTGRRTPSIHVRSQSMPVVNTLRGRNPLPSENWDDDFLDDGDEGFSISSEMVIPQEIKERQASVIGHLGCVREFALLVEDLKRFRDTAVLQGIRNGAHMHLWDEADGIIALASLDNEEEDEPLRKEKLKRQRTWSPRHSGNERATHEGHIEEASASVTSNRRSSVLLPDDDIFGGSHSATPSHVRVKQTLRSSPTPSSTSPHSKRGMEREDPIEAAKNMMEKMQTRQHSEYIIAASRTSKGHSGGKVHFDTNMLRELVAHVRALIRQLKGALEEAHSSVVANSLVRSTYIDRHDMECRDLDLSSVDGSFDDNFGIEAEAIGRATVQSRQAIGIV